MILLILFIFISLWTETIFFVMGNFELMVNAIGTDEMKEQGELRFLQAQITSIALTYNYVMFTEGKNIWKWITKRDEVIQQINEKAYPQN